MYPPIYPTGENPVKLLRVRVRATIGALAIRLDGHETPDEVSAALIGLPSLPLEVEVSGPVRSEALEALITAAKALDTSLTLKPPRGERFMPYTEVVAHTLRSGQRIESSSTVVVLGDVNPGAEIAAGGDVIVVGKLRGLAHAGALGNQEAAIWALSVEAKQLRIAEMVARAPEDGFSGRGAERARIIEGQILLEPWGRKEI